MNENTTPTTPEVPQVAGVTKTPRVFNPKGLEIGQLTQVYVFNNSRETGTKKLMQAILVTATGRVFHDGHYETEEEMALDMGCYEGHSSPVQSAMDEAFDEGYVVEFVPSALTETHEGVNEAMRLNKERQVEKVKALDQLLGSLMGSIEKVVGLDTSEGGEEVDTETPLPELKPGDWIRATKGSPGFYEKGAEGVLVRKDGDGFWWANFSNRYPGDAPLENPVDPLDNWCVGLEGVSFERVDTLSTNLPAFKSGDLVRITKGDHPFVQTGTLARLTRQDIDGSWWAELDGLGNPEGSFRTTKLVLPPRTSKTEWCLEHCTYGLASKGSVKAG